MRFSLLTQFVDTSVDPKYEGMLHTMCLPDCQTCQTAKDDNVWDEDFCATRLKLQKAVPLTFGLGNHIFYTVSQNITSTYGPKYTQKWPQELDFS